MNQESKKTKKAKAKGKNKVEIRDLKPKKDVKGGDGPSENISLTYGSIKYKH